MNKFIRQNFACAASVHTRLYLGCFRGDLDNIIPTHFEMMEVSEGCFLFGRSRFAAMP